MQIGESLEPCSSILRLADARDFGHFVTGQLHKLNETEILYFMTQVHPDAWPNNISERHLKSVWLHRRSLLAAHRSPRRTCLG